MPSAAACSPISADVRPDPDRLTRLEDELTTLTGHINAATARFLSVLAEFDRLEGWRPHGLFSTAHWLHWRCGFGLNAAREKVRVARALAELPQIRACFETGSLSYSKVRAMTRIATPANEDVLLLVARHGTTRHVETLVSKWRGAERSREVQRAGRQHAVRSLRWHYDDDGCLVIRATLPREQGALPGKGPAMLTSSTSTSTRRPWRIRWLAAPSWPRAPASPPRGAEWRNGPALRGFWGPKRRESCGRCRTASPPRPSSAEWC
mgnify:CR=1 FL=1